MKRIALVEVELAEEDYDKDLSVVEILSNTFTIPSVTPLNVKSVDVTNYPPTASLAVLESLLK